MAYLFLGAVVRHRVVNHNSVEYGAAAGLKRYQDADCLYAAGRCFAPVACDALHLNGKEFPRHGTGGQKRGRGQGRGQGQGQG